MFSIPDQQYLSLYNHHAMSQKLHCIIRTFTRQADLNRPIRTSLRLNITGDSRPTRSDQFCSKTVEVLFWPFESRAAATICIGEASGRLSKPFFATHGRWIRGPASSGKTSGKTAIGEIGCEF